MRGMRSWTLSGIVVLSVAIPLAWAQESAGTSSGETPRISRPEPTLSWAPIEKFGRGVSNLFGGWLEIPQTVHERYSERDTAGSLVSGTVVGTIKAVWRTAIGCYETVTFLIPIPQDYAPILPTLDYFDVSKRQALPLN